MIRNVVLHLHGELPMQADIESLPTAADVGLLCTNLRTIDGKKPLSTEFLDSVFLIPFSFVRFLEIPRASIDTATPSPTQPRITADAGAAGSDPIVVTPPVPTAPTYEPPSAPTEPSEPAPEDVRLEDLEPDADLLRRIREA